MTKAQLIEEIVSLSFSKREDWSDIARQELKKMPYTEIKRMRYDLGKLMDFTLTVIEGME